MTLQQIPPPVPYGLLASDEQAIAGSINTTTPTINQGTGFTVVKNSTGNITVTFATAFSDVPRIITNAVGAGDRSTSTVGPTTTSFSVIREIASTGVVEDGNIHFIAYIPGTTASWNPPACRVYKATAQTINNVTNTLVTLDSEDYDTAGMHDTATLNTRVFARKRGIYSVTGLMQVASVGTGTMVVGLVLNGTTTMAETTTSGATSEEICITTDYLLNVNDYVELQGWQNTGAGQNMRSQNGARGPTLMMHWVAPV